LALCVSFTHGINDTDFFGDYCDAIKLAASLQRQPAERHILMIIERAGL
jgi:hypothetical protein